MIQNAYDYLIQDPTLSPVVKKYPLPNSVSDQLEIHESLIKSIISQQLSIKAAQTIYERFTKLIDQKSELEIITTISIEQLRSVGLSKQKALYVQNVATFFLQKENKKTNWQSLSNQEIIEKLIQIKGVGVWTIHMLLIFNLDRKDVLPLGDLIVRKGLMNILGLTESNKTTIQQILDHSLRWSPHRSYVSRLMWAAKEELVK